MGSGSSSKSKKKYTADAQALEQDAQKEQCAEGARKEQEEDTTKNKTGENEAKKHRRHHRADENGNESEHRHHMSEHHHKKPHHVENKAALQENVFCSEVSTMFVSCSEVSSMSDPVAMCISSEADSDPILGDPSDAKSKRGNSSPSPERTGAEHCDNDPATLPEKNEDATAGEGTTVQQIQQPTKRMLKAEPDSRRSSNCGSVKSGSSDPPKRAIVTPPQGRSASKLDAELGLVTRRPNSSPLQVGGLSVLGAVSRRPSTGGLMVEGDPRMTANSAEPLSPARQARRASFQAHRVAVLTDPLSLESPTSKHDPISPKTPGSSKSKGSNHKHSDGRPDSPSSPGHRDREKVKGRRGSVLGAESLAVLQQLRDAAKEEVDDGLCGFKVGDRVSTAGGRDAHGPWEQWGDGVVLDGALFGFKVKKGFLLLSFEKSPDKFEVKATNLTNLTDKSRSGAHTIKHDGPQVNKQQRKFVHPDDTFESNDVFRIGEHVALVNGGVGVLVKEGKTPDLVLVRFGDLGIRSVRRAQLTKVKCTNMEKLQAAENAAMVDDTNRNRFTLSLKEATEGFNEKTAWSEDLKAVEVEKEDEFVVVAKSSEDEDPNCGLKVGYYVKVTDKVNPLWKGIGVGCIRSQGKKLGTLDVQFDSGGETWCVQASMLKRVCPPERKFRKLGEKIVPETIAGKEHTRDVHKVAALCA